MISPINGVAEDMFMPRDSFPKIVMTILVKDEVDVIRENIEYHLSRGVDYFIVTDNDSSDGTTEILREYERKGVLSYIHQDGVYSQSEWVTQMARTAHLDHQADWVINNDADEFWWHDCGCLKVALSNVSSRCEVVAARRHNMLLPAEVDEGADRVPFYERMIYRRQVSINRIGKPLPGKVCSRGTDDVVVHAGAHSVSSPSLGEPCRSDIEIIHFPVRSREQLERKVVNLGRSYEQNPQVDPVTGARPGNASRRIYADYKQDPAILEKVLEQFVAKPLESDPDGGDFMVKDLRVRDAIVADKVRAGLAE